MSSDDKNLVNDLEAAGAMLEPMLLDAFSRMAKAMTATEIAQRQLIFERRSNLLRAKMQKTACEELFRMLQK